MPIKAPNVTNKHLITTALTVALAASVAGCGSTSKFTTGSISRSDNRPLETMSANELHSATARLGDSYARNPNDKRIATNFAAALQMDGDADQSLAVMRKLAIAYPKDRDVLAAYGKALAANGQFEQALDAVRRAQTPEYPDWRLVSAEAAILDQMGQRDEARQDYRKALELKPNEPSILSNLGMSYVLEGDLRTAETYMRSAAQQPSADSRVRQNLALVVGLQGRFDEAEKIASQELSPEQAQANIAYLRQMLAQQNAWSQLKDQDKAKVATN
ncbi:MULTISPECIES: tetratricopeptide repeat protein [unclassified Mesorhizobium]|uniref:tetratricopeptide repeat protein n=1 Tax=unclassified Mesorhizobium TaxID=325217 RepID=UPI000FCC21D0|nr:MULTISPECIES: tetratricopeptide repeat protein [unclassified Mesorhizobium]RUW32254.1 tetratricopeptide repeat protein [Mesorhizobium sp. M1E.F.Ca.ET.041.01.1.1]RWD89493.1 MAG: tetratricopeptide repeat protein [Mesorhizobium sp.]RWD93016.1 MAG: tetratricopeptide repeat protein [Mesorhizobium sp.]TIV53043.1 MAG: tetratricopeptide repeat protein [Mesorhizobium sp.]